MLYSGADLIRSSGQQQERLDRLNTADAPLRPVAPPEKPNSATDGETQGALLRFARFIHKEGEKKKKPSQSETTKASAPAAAGDLYAQAESHRQRLFDRGHQLDIYI
jgi:hypothetical protein